MALEQLVIDFDVAPQELEIESYVLFRLAVKAYQDQHDQALTELGQDQPLCQPKCQMPVPDHP